MTEKEKYLIRQYLWSVIYLQRAVLKSARSFIGTDSEWLARHVIRHYPKRCHDSIKSLREKRDRDGYWSIANFIKADLERRNQTIEQYVEAAKTIHCFDQSIIIAIPRIMPVLVKNETVTPESMFIKPGTMFNGLKLELEPDNKVHIPSFVWKKRTN